MIRGERLRGVYGSWHLRPMNVRESRVLLAGTQANEISCWPLFSTRISVWLGINP